MTEIFFPDRQRPSFAYFTPPCSFFLCLQSREKKKITERRVFIFVFRDLSVCCSRRLTDELEKRRWEERVHGRPAVGGWKNRVAHLLAHHPTSRVCLMASRRLDTCACNSLSSGRGREGKRAGREIQRVPTVG
jgi:hypothetical protein